MIRCASHVVVNAVVQLSSYTLCAAGTEPSDRNAYGHGLGNMTLTSYLNPTFTAALTGIMSCHSVTCLSGNFITVHATLPLFWILKSQNSSTLPNYSDPSFQQFPHLLGQWDITFGNAVTWIFVNILCLHFDFILLTLLMSSISNISACTADVVLMLFTHDTWLIQRSTTLIVIGQSKHGCI